MIVQKGSYGADCFHLRRHCEYWERLHRDVLDESIWAWCVCTVGSSHPRELRCAQLPYTTTLPYSRHLHSLRLHKRRAEARRVATRIWARSAGWHKPKSKRVSSARVRHSLPARSEKSGNSLWARSAGWHYAMWKQILLAIILRPLPTRSPKSGNSHLGSLGVKQHGSPCDDHKRPALSSEADAAGGHSTSGHSTGGHSTGGHSISGHSTSGHRMCQKSRYSGWNRATGQRSSAMT